MVTKPLFEEGDYVILKDDPAGYLWQVLERKGKRYLVGDVGYETSNLIKNWHDESELEADPGDEDLVFDDEDFEPDEDSPMFCDWDDE